MSITTYAELRTAVANWLDRSDLTDRIPEFVALANARLNRTLRVRKMLRRVRTQFDTSFLAFPTDCLEIRSIEVVGDRLTPLSLRSDWELDRMKYNDASTGVPTDFAIIGETIEFYRPPAELTVIELTYLRSFSLVADEDTNWLLESYPDIYLYETLRHSAPLLKNDERIAVWAGLGDAAMAELAERDNHAQNSGSPLNSRTSSPIRTAGVRW